MINSKAILVIMTCCLSLSCARSKDREATSQSDKTSAAAPESAAFEDAAGAYGGHSGVQKSPLDLAPADTASAGAARVKGDSTPEQGRWREYRGGSARRALTAQQEEQVRKLQSIGYLSGSRPGPSGSGVVKYDESRAYRGYNLYVSGHSPEAVLMDMQGKILHTWSHDFADIWPGREFPEELRGRDMWRRAYLYENGDLLAIHEGICLIKLDKNSNLLWVYEGGCHHDLDVTPDGKIYVLARKAAVIPRINENDPVLEDFIVVLDANGNELKRISILEAMERSDYKRFLAHMLKKGDIFHTNTIEVLDGRLAGISPAFKAGNVLISILKINTIAVIDLKTEKAVWALVGRWRRQHQPTVLDNGKLLIFDNQGLRKMRSRVIEFDPVTKEIGWAYSGTKAQRLYSESCGSCQRLPNGNTLITESDNGRALEVTPDKTVVWEFINPHRAGKDGELIATLFEVIRLKPEFPLDWLQQPH
jgi:hypothetical protein